MTDYEKGYNDALNKLKQEIHEKAVYPHHAGINPYIQLNVVDALVNNLMKGN